MLRPIPGTAAVLFLSCAAFAQVPNPTLTFEVASVKPAAPQPVGRISVGMRGGPGTPDPGRITYTNVSLLNVLTNAYGVKRPQIQGPAWLDSERFDITATVPQGATKDDVKVMLQNLLAERFKLALHREKKELPMYALVVGKNGPKLKESVEQPAPKDSAAPPAIGYGGAPPFPPPPPPGGSHEGGMMGGRVTVGKDGFPQLPPGAGRMGTMLMVSNGRFRMQANRQSMAGLADMLSNQLDRPVVDMTELKGNYDFTLDYTPEEGQRVMGPMGAMPPPMVHEGGAPPGGGPAEAASDPTGPSLFTAIQEQLGLKLEPRKGPVNLLVIDHLEKVPTEN